MTGVESTFDTLAKVGASGLLVYFALRAVNFLEKWFERAVVALEAIKSSVENMDDKLDRALDGKGQ
jgi:hypothetical protein